MSHIAVLQRLNQQGIFKFVRVPEGQSLEMDDGPGEFARSWLRPHLGNEWHLIEFAPLEELEQLLPWTIPYVPKDDLGVPQRVAGAEQQGNEGGEYGAR